MQQTLSTEVMPLWKLSSLSSRLTIGSTICITEGISGTVMTMVPQNHWFYLIGMLLVFINWWALDRFRSSKLGADISELCFFDALVRSLAAGFYFMGINSAIGWFFSIGISAMKLIRVYSPQSTVTQENGWAVFGFVTHFYARKYPITGAKRAMYQSLVLAILGGAIASIVFRQLSDVGRVAASWVVPLSFELINGPIQLRALDSFIRDLIASKQRIAEQAAEIAQLKLALQAKYAAEAAQDAHLAAIATAINATAPHMHEHMMHYAQSVAETYPRQSGAAE